MEVELLKKKDIDEYIKLIYEIFGYESNKEAIEKLIKKSKVLIIKKDDIIVASANIEERYESAKQPLH